MVSRNMRTKTLPLMRGTLWWIAEDKIANEWQKSDFADEIRLHREIGFDLLWIFNTPKLIQDAIEKQEKGQPRDVLKMVFEIADKYGMRVIVDLPKPGWYGETSRQEMVAITHKYISHFHERYDSHPSFYGWYLNYEINPIHPKESEESAFWRHVWKETVAECHRIAPESVVTISPFFLLDKEELRGYSYLEPDEYEQWWSETLAETKIDILMLQDSGEHLSFYTLEQREPFFAAFSRACQKAGTKFWMNVETGEMNVSNLDEYIALERKALSFGQDGLTTFDGVFPWRFTPIDWLEKKLNLAASYGENIINWGYYPFMAQNPMQATDSSIEDRLQAYHDYKIYYKRVKSADHKECK